MITRDEMFEEVLKACPSFVPTWRAFCQEWEDEAELPMYLALSEFARHLIRMLEDGEDSGLKAVFEIVEKWHLNGDPYVSEAVTIGLLEDLQNEGLHKTTTPDEFVRFLLPESKFWWAKVTAFWQHGHPIVDDR
ncbi:MAG: hypothetical protein V3S55_13175 [Nitrospiraceae bacterium]|jgi:hypothetical protein